MITQNLHYQVFKEQNLRNQMISQNQVKLSKSNYS